MKVNTYHEVSKVVKFLRSNAKINDSVVALMGCKSAGVDYGNLSSWFSNHYLKDSLGVDFLPTELVINKLIQEYEEKHKKDLKELYSSLKYSSLSRWHNFDELDFSGAIDCITKMVVGILRSTGEIIDVDKEFTDEQKKKLDSDGYLLIPNVLSKKKVDALSKLTMLIAEQERAAGVAYTYGIENKLQRVYNLIFKHPLFVELLEMPLVNEILRYHFRAPHLHPKYVLSSFLANIIGAGGDEDKLHIDSAVPEPLPPWPIRLNVNFLLTDFTKDNGATLCSPGSHKLCSIPSGENPVLEKLIAPRGSLAIWNGHLWHKSGANHTDQPRFSLNAGFGASYLKEMSTEEEHLVVIDEETKESLSPEMRLLVGLDRGIKCGSMYKPDFSNTEFSFKR